MFNIKRDIYEIEAEMRRRYNRLKSNYVYASFGPSAPLQFSEVIPLFSNPQKVITIGDIRPDEAMASFHETYGQNLSLALTKAPKNSTDFTSPNYNHPAYTLPHESSSQASRALLAHQTQQIQTEAYERDKLTIMDRAKILTQEKWERQQQNFAQQEEKKIREKDRADAKVTGKIDGDRLLKGKENSQINIM